MRVSSRLRSVPERAKHTILVEHLWVIGAAPTVPRKPSSVPASCENAECIRLRFENRRSIRCGLPACIVENVCHPFTASSAFSEPRNANTDRTLIQIQGQTHSFDCFPQLSEKGYTDIVIDS